MMRALLGVTGRFRRRSICVSAKLKRPCGHENPPGHGAMHNVADMGVLSQVAPQWGVGADQ